MDMQKQQEEMERKQKREALKKKLHAEINPVDMKDVFDARKKKTQQDLESVRKELQALAVEIARFRKDVDIATFQQIVDPGQEGVYYTSFLQQLRNFIMLLRKKVQSARTWMQQSQAKQAKKKKKGGKKPGMEMGGAKHEQSKTVFDTMHHERSSSYGGS
jgi:regulatory protein YycH of two-component signal transduction system YycFG